ncbi:hypothetical protein DIZ27_12520 [Streptomyces sp. NWU339]|uniref:cytochrome P450 n=1 Tax=Streptomyces sp. NWU339 TaxID=2185284 RepID=UPI000D675D30|nr:cytochrome P450 [Streptomyces sp. NWU339]PWI10418.1 hypothetical protein DIZ27_12520 [Streptomyces sp. NWU339]
MEKRRVHPADDPLTDLVEADLEGEHPLTDDEILQMLVQFLVAGNETTTNLIGSSVLRLLQEPDLLSELRRAVSRVPTFVEEVLRLEAPTQGMFRTATRDCTIGGQAITAGSMIYLIYGSANRDAEVFTHSDDIVPDKPVAHHLAFGRGEHVCLGAHLARREATIAVETLLRRLDTLSSAAPGTEPDYNSSFILRGPRSLPVHFTITPVTD